MRAFSEFCVPHRIGSRFNQGIFFRENRVYFCLMIIIVGHCRVYLRGRHRQALDNLINRGVLTQMEVNQRGDPDTLARDARLAAQNAGSLLYISLGDNRRLIHT